jgi:DNA-binding MarR family transcriptional regulator
MRDIREPPSGASVADVSVMSRTQSREAVERYAYPGLDCVIHERARLGVLTSLATGRNELLFSELKRLCRLTKGNLSKHLKVLRKRGFVEIIKSIQANRPQTLVRLKWPGRERYLGYLSVLEQVIRDAGQGTEAEAADGRPDAASSAEDA